MKKCEFCGVTLEYDASYTLGDVSVHPACFKAAVKALAKHAKEAAPKLITKQVSPWKPAYMVMMDPNETLKSAPREQFKSYDQAMAVAAKLVKETGKSFWVMLHISSTSLE